MSSLNSVKRYEEKVFSNLTPEEIDIKNSFDHGPRFGGTGDPSDTSYLKAIIESEKLASNMAKVQDDEAVAEFRMRSFSRAYPTEDQQSMLAHPSYEIKKPMPTIAPTITIKSKRRKLSSGQYITASTSHTFQYASSSSLQLNYSDSSSTRNQSKSNQSLASCEPNPGVDYKETNVTDTVDEVFCVSKSVEQTSNVSSDPSLSALPIYYGSDEDEDTT